jgi:hypothetical protein
VLGSDINSPAAVAAGITSPYPGFTGDVAQALRNWPQYQNIDYFAVPTGSSMYNSVEVRFQERMSHGLQAQIAYTWSRFMVDTAENGMSHFEPSGPQNPADTHRGEWARCTDGVPQILLATFNYDLPFGRGRQFLNQSAVADEVVGGWSLAGILRYEAGRPLQITMNNNLGGFLFNSEKRPNKVGSGKGDTSRGMIPSKDLYLLSSGWADPGPLKFGNEPRTDPSISGFPNYEEDLTLIKDIKLYHEDTFRIEVEDSNAFNRHTWCDPNTFWGGSGFGQVSGQCNFPRRIEFAGKLRF